jgi:NADH-quinone oxidoreductase subunit G
MGALTSKPYAFSARPWELDHVDSFDFFDVLGSSIRLDFRGPVLMRVLPRLNSSLNEDWIADKIRFSLVDGCFRQRVTKCYTRIGVQKFSTFGSRTWFQVSTQVKKYLCSLSKINFLIALGCFVDLEFCVSLKNYIVKSDKNFNFFSFLGFLGYPTHDWRFDFLFSSDQLEFLEQSSVVVFCGFNPATVPVLNVRFRRMSQKNPLTLFFNFGSSHHKFGYDVVNVGSTWQSLIQFFEGRSRLCSLFCRSTKKLIVVGDEFYSMFSSFVPNSLLESLRSKFLSSLTIFYVPRFTSTPSFLELGASSNVSFENHVPFLTSSPSQLMLDLTGMKPSSTASINFFNFGHEFVSLSSMLFNSSRFYSVSHATERLFDSDCILSSAAHLEKISSFINITGRLQTAGSYLI